jgi:hypothetical protein
LERLNIRAASPDFAPSTARLRREESAFLKLQLAVPELPGGYYHDYICPEHGVELHFLADSPHAHACPVDGRVFEGQLYDAAWRWFVNHELAEAALRLAVLRRIEGGRAEALRGILLGYADRYAQYAITPRTGDNPGVATYTTLDESVWSVPLAWAFDLASDAFSTAEGESVVTRLFIPAAEHLVKRHYSQVHNFSCWHNAAIATLARISKRPDLLEWSIQGPSGQRVQLNQGMLPDGLWFEGSTSYHFYSLWAILISALAARHDAALDIFSDPAITRALATPIDCAYADATLPATNDSWYFTSLTGETCHGVPPGPDYYEIGYSVYGEAAFAAVLSRAYTQAPRDGIYALLFGADRVPATGWPPRRSLHLRASGQAFLRPADDLDLMLKFGSHGGHHGHPDKLSLTGYSRGWRFSPDLGTPGYGVESLESWYRQTLSHNTVLIDGVSQPPTTGTLHRLETAKLPHVADAAAEWTEGGYGGVRMRRIVLACAEYFVDIFQVSCAGPRRIDWIFHCTGVWAGDAPSEPAAIEGADGYGHLSGARKLHGEVSQRAAWKDADGSLHMWLSPSPEDVFIGSAPANPPSLCYGFLLRSRTAAETSFIAVAHPFGPEVLVRNVIWSTPRCFEVELNHRRDSWDVSLLPEGREIYRRSVSSTI